MFASDLISPVGEKAGTRGETKTKPNNRKNRCGPSVAVRLGRQTRRGVGDKYVKARFRTKAVRIADTARAIRNRRPLPPRAENFPRVRDGNAAAAAFVFARFPVPLARGQCSRKPAVAHDMSPTFAVCIWATAAFAACSARTRTHCADDDAARPRYQSRATSVFGPSGHAPAAGFPYRFVFPANHPALNGPAAYPQYSHYPQNPRQSEQLQYAADDVYALTSSKHVPFAEHKQPQPHHHHHHHHQQQQQQQQHQPQQLGFESVGKLQYELFGGGGGGGKHHAQQPYHMTKQPKHYPNHELAPSAPAAVHQSPYVPAGGGPVAQPVMLLIPSGQPGAPYQTLVLVPSSSVSAIPPGFPGMPPPAFPGRFGADLPVVRGLPLQVAGFPSAAAQLFHRSHDPAPVQPYPRRQQAPHAPRKPPPYHRGSGSEHVPQSTGGGADVQQPLEDKVGHGTGASAENSDGRVDASAETSGDGKTPSTEFGDKTSTKTPTRIVVT